MASVCVPTISQVKTILSGVYTSFTEDFLGPLSAVAYITMLAKI